MDNRKYIGMDVHKEAIAIAVLNAAGKLVMESIIETKANTILEFLKGLRGELHLTFEEGTWASWLYELLQPHVKRVVVCNPRRNALLKEGSKSDRVDARKLAELLYTKMLRPVYHRDNGMRAVKELARSYVNHQQRSGTGDDPGEGVVSKLGDCLLWKTDLHRPPPGELARENQGTWRAASGRFLLSATGWIAVSAPASAPRVVGGE